MQKHPSAPGLSRQGGVYKILHDAFAINGEAESTSSNNEGSNHASRTGIVVGQRTFYTSEMKMAFPVPLLVIPCLRA